MKCPKIFLLLFFSSRLLAQNLIPNPGFDSIISCPDGKSQIFKAPPWISASGGTPDLYNVCSSDDSYGVPYSGIILCEFQVPISGNGYAGIFVYSRHEFMGTSLRYPMKKNIKYYLRFFVSPDSDCLLGAQLESTDAVGLALSDTLNFFNVPANQVIPLVPAIEHKGSVIKDTINWTKISGCYTAKGGERYAIIGNFRTDAETILEIEGPAFIPNINYFFIEDVLVMPFDPLPDTLLLCGGEAATFNAGFLDATYQWSTGETDSIVTINAAGQYVVEAFVDDCVLQDTMLVLDAGELQDFSADTTVCSDGQLILSPPMPGEYEWSDGSQGGELVVTTSGTYEVTVTNECGIFQFSTEVTVEDCACKIYAPYSFSPNGDGINDELRVFVGCDFPYLFKRFEVFDRWGSRVYAASEVQEIAWDGSFGGKPLPTGVYVWFLEYEVTRDGKTERRIEKGDALILR